MDGSLGGSRRCLRCDVMLPPLQLHLLGKFCVNPPRCHFPVVHRFHNRGRADAVATREDEVDVCLVSGWIDSEEFGATMEKKRI